MRKIMRICLLFVVLSHVSYAACELDGAACDLVQGNRDLQNACFFSKTMKLLDQMFAQSNIKYVVFGSYSAYLSGVPLSKGNFPGDIDVAVSNPKAARDVLKKSECFTEKRGGLGVAKYVSRLGTGIDLVEGQDFGFSQFFTNAGSGNLVKRDGVTIPVPLEVLKLTILRPQTREKDAITIAYMIATGTFSQDQQKELLQLLVRKQMAAPNSNWTAVVNNARAFVDQMKANL